MSIRFFAVLGAWLVLFTGCGSDSDDGDSGDDATSINIEGDQIQVGDKFDVDTSGIECLFRPDLLVTLPLDAELTGASDPMSQLTEEVTALQEPRIVFPTEADVSGLDNQVIGSLEAGGYSPDIVLESIDQETARVSSAPGFTVIETPVFVDPDQFNTGGGIVFDTEQETQTAQVLANRLSGAEISGLLSVNDQGTVDLIASSVDVWRVVDGVGLNSLQLAVLLQSAGIPATPILAFQLAGHWTFAPGSDRTEVALDSPPTLTTPGESPSTVAVIDTGVPPESTDETRGLKPLDAVVDVEQRDAEDPYRWHGAFVSSLVRQVEPSSTVAMVRLGDTTADEFAAAGTDALSGVGIKDGEVNQQLFASDELQFLHAVSRLTSLDKEASDLRALNVSGGTYGCGDLGVALDGNGDVVDSPTTDGMVVPVAEWAALQIWLGYAPEGAPMVAAAGNDSHNQEADPDFYPAAIPGVLGVASIKSDGRLSDFSNKGDLCAVGDGVVGLTPEGAVAWSGTSFAAPIVAASLVGDPDKADGYDANQAECGTGDRVDPDNDVLACTNLEAPATAAAVTFHLSDTGSAGSTASSGDIGGKGVACSGASG